MDLLALIKLCLQEQDKSSSIIIAFLVIHAHNINIYQCNMSGFILIIHTNDITGTFCTFGNPLKVYIFQEKRTLYGNK